MTDLSFNGPPSIKSLWSGCILGSIAHAVSTVKFPELSHEQSWDGQNYSVQDTAGTMGTISFSPDMVFGAFRDEHSPRLKTFRDASYYIEGAPESIVKFAQQEALQYLLDDVNGITMPVITSAFWSENGRIVSRELWPTVVTHGAHILLRQLLPFDLAMEAWAEECELDSAMMDVVKQLYDTRTEQPEGLITISEDCSAVLQKHAESHSAINEARTSFAGIGIAWRAV